ncbi:MAG: FMN-binding glutamate synthase family protein [Flavobacteriales bacterium]|jgi:glutamate synthase domain-containing protein 2|nr:FMN-binding glutamate synthase family protein [Flavobacteriales bacterium]
MNVRKTFLIIAITLITVIIGTSIFWKPIMWSLIIIGPILIIGFRDISQKKHTIKKNFPVIGNFRYLLEKIRPEIMQYFVETDTEGRPINRIKRSLVYQRAKKVTDTTPFGTQLDVYATGYEWMAHSIYAKDAHNLDLSPRVTIGGKDCKHPYSASILNISAMSFGSLSKNAVLAMNGGAKEGNFAQNTGEGGVSPYHLKHDGDLIWQIGTGYFGCRTKDGNFSEEGYQQTVSHPSVKMVELKISQGAKPGHGGILPAKKNTLEIAKIRHVEPYKAVHSPPGHSAFNDSKGLLLFIKKLRDLSGGKPVGFKLCIGQKEEFIDIISTIKETGIAPDFITIDGGEGGTGAAPIEFSNSLGMPLRDGLAFAINTLKEFGLREEIKVFAAGKILTGFDMARVMAIGADVCYSARAMMLATGCIQALLCNTNTCPVGIATQNEALMNGLNVPDKISRVANYHEETVKSFIEMLAASGLESPQELERKHILRRMNSKDVISYAEIFPEQQLTSHLAH